MFSPVEANCLKSQFLARLATVDNKGQPDVVPVGFEFDDKYFWIGSHSQDIFFQTKRYSNVKKGNNSIALVIDDLQSVNPWKPRSIKVYGMDEVIEHEGRFGTGKYLRVTLKISWSMGIETRTLWNDGSEVMERSWRTKTIHT